MNIIISPSNQTSNIGLYQNCNECMACEKIAEILTKMLKNNGYSADYFTKATKIDDRINLVNNVIKPDLYLIIHTNAVSNPIVRGCEAYVRYNDTISRSIANKLVKIISTELPTNQRAVKNAEFMELKNISNDIPTVYLECDFHTNPDAVKILQFEPERVARIITNVIKDALPQPENNTITIVINKLKEIITMLEGIK